jgi:PD-(D/E)XK nuclease superfamily
MDADGNNGQTVRDNSSHCSMISTPRNEESRIDSKGLQTERSLRHGYSRNIVEEVFDEGPTRALQLKNNRVSSRARLQDRGLWRHKGGYITIAALFILFEAYNQCTKLNTRERRTFVLIESFCISNNMIRIRPSKSADSPILLFLSRTKTINTQAGVVPRCRGYRGIQRCCHHTFLPPTRQQQRSLSTHLNVAPASLPPSSSVSLVSTLTTKRTRKTRAPTTKQSLPIPSNTTTVNTKELPGKSVSKVVTKTSSSTRQQRNDGNPTFAENDDIGVPLTPLHTNSESVLNTSTNATSANNNTTSFPYMSNSNKKTGFQPSDILDPSFRIPYPKALSPSSIAEFKKCPQSYLFQYVLGMKQPTTLALAKGSMCHAALERIFDLDPSDRSLDVLQNLFRAAWSEHRTTEVYKTLFAINNVAKNDGDDGIFDHDLTKQHDVQAEIQWGREGLALLANYWSKEDASQIVRPNPIQREIWVASKLRVNRFELPSSDNDHVTEDSDDTLFDFNTSASDDSIDEQFLVRGIVDRLDMVRCNDTPLGESTIALRLIDYKTGKAPDLKYTVAMNDKIQQEAFDQLLIYALLLREKSRSKSKGSSSSDVSTSSSSSLTPTTTIPLRFLRLFYLTSHNKDDDIVPQQRTIASPAVYWEMDLGATQVERDAVLDDVYQDLIIVWQSITRLIREQNLHTFHGCTRSFCTCHLLRPLFPVGTVWEPGNTELRREK